MKKINRIISIITSLSLTFVSSVYIVSAKKQTIQTTQSSSSNQNKPANKTPVIIKSTPPKKGQLKTDPIPYAIDPRITNKHLNLLRHMKTLSYVYVVDFIAVASELSALIIPALQASGIVLPAEIIALTPPLMGIGALCTVASLITKLVSLFINQPF